MITTIKPITTTITKESNRISHEMLELFVSTYWSISLSTVTVEQSLEILLVSSTVIPTSSWMSSNRVTRIRRPEPEEDDVDDDADEYGDEFRKKVVDRVFA